MLLSADDLMIAFNSAQSSDSERVSKLLPKQNSRPESTGRSRKASKELYKREPLLIPERWHRTNHFQTRADGNLTPLVKCAEDFFYFLFFIF